MSFLTLIRLQHDYVDHNVMYGPRGKMFTGNILKKIVQNVLNISEAVLLVNYFDSTVCLPIVGATGKLQY